MIQLVTARHADTALEWSVLNRLGSLHLWPEHDHRSRPRHAHDVIEYMRGYLDKQVEEPTLESTLVTMHEAPFLMVVRYHAEKKFKPGDVRIVYAQGPTQYMVLRIDEDGEFLDKWPGPDGFFEWRGDLLFGKK